MEKRTSYASTKELSIDFRSRSVGDEPHSAEIAVVVSADGPFERMALDLVSALRGLALLNGSETTVRGDFVEAHLPLKAAVAATLLLVYGRSDDDPDNDVLFRMVRRLEGYVQRVRCASDEPSTLFSLRVVRGGEAAGETA